MAAVLTCPECGAPMRLRESRFGPFFGCTTWPKCDATHGAHPDGTPLGTPADKATKRARIEAHAAFDPLWKDIAEVYPNLHGRALKRLRGLARSRAYQWLAAQLGIPVERCHIGMFDAETCARVVAVCERARAAQVREWAKAREKTHA